MYVCVCTCLPIQVWVGSLPCLGCPFSVLSFHDGATIRVWFSSCSLELCADSLTVLCLWLSQLICPGVVGYVSISCATLVNVSNKDIWLGLIIMCDNPAKWGSQNKNPKSKIYSKCQLEWRWSPCSIIAEVFWKLSGCATSVCDCMLWSSG